MKRPFDYSNGTQEKSGKVLKKITGFQKWKIDNKVRDGQKVCVVDWNYPDVAEALKARGWHQNPDPDSIHFDLKYSRCARIPKNLCEWQTFNHFPKNYNLSAKWNLCETIKNNEQLAKFNHLGYFPRCFQMEKEGFLEFSNTFKVIYCAGVLKKFVLNLENFSPKVLSLCNSICKKWVSELKSIGPKGKNMIITDSEWREVQSKTPDESSPQVLISDIKKTLNSLKKSDPQFALSGHLNIWIIKPGRKSRGRDIKVLQSLEEIKEYTSIPNYWVAQKYIENPLLINSRKFDIRQWVLITSFDPLVIWIYKKCYLRFTAEEFSFSDLSNNFKHLTNNSVSKESSQFADWGHMWDLEEFQNFLISLTGNDIWTDSLFPSIKKVIISSITTAGKLYRKNSFELLGFDLMVDEEMKPWLIEVNTSPAMDYSTVIKNQRVTERLVKEVSEDLVKVLVDHGEDMGSFELCYQGSKK